MHDSITNSSMENKKHREWISSRRNLKRKFPANEVDISIPQKRVKLSRENDHLQRKILCPCLFPHCRRMYELYINLPGGKSYLQKRHRSLISKYEWNGEMMANTAVELFYNSDSILKLLEENTNGKGHKDGCLSQEQSWSEGITVCAVSIPDINFDHQMQQIHQEMRRKTKFDQDNYTVICKSKESFAGNCTENMPARTYVVENNGKVLRATISFMIEKPINDSLQKCRLWLEDEKSTVLSHFCTHRPLTRRQTSAFKKAAANNLLATKYLSEPYDYWLDRIVSLQNELIREPGVQITRAAAMEVPRAIHSELIKIREVSAFGFIHDILEIWIDEDKVSLDRYSLETKLQNLLHGDVLKPCRIRYVRFSPTTDKIKPGDKMYRTKEGSEYGTVGMFAESEKDLVAITVFHVLQGIERAFVRVEDGSTELGVVLSLNDSLRETIGFVQVKESEKNRIELKLEMNKRMLNSQIFERRRHENLALIKQKVYKKGATTLWTEGFVKLDEQYPDKQGIIIEGINGNFSQGGDSGSAIIRFKPNDPDDTEVEVISILSGDYNDRYENKTIGTFSLSLKKPLDLLSEAKKTKYNLR